MRVVLDTSTLVAAFLQPDHLPAQVLGAVLARHRFIVSPAMAAEYAAVLTRPRFAHLGSAKQRQRDVQNLVSDLCCESVVPRRRLALVPRDEDDNRFLEAAVESRADLVVSSDPHLPALGSLVPPTVPTPIPILTPADALPPLTDITEGREARPAE